jgi:D-inositol-3-phosphate glycosyltransferase
MVDQLGIQQQVNFIGRIGQTHLPVYYGAADLLALPSDYESFGLVCLEALACGTPVVATAVGAVEKLINRADNGTIVAPKTPEALAKGIQRVLSHRPKQSAPQSIRASVSAYDWSHVASNIANEYHIVHQQCQNFKSYDSHSPSAMRVME